MPPCSSTKWSDCRALYAAVVRPVLVSRTRPTAKVVIFFFSFVGVNEMGNQRRWGLLDLELMPGLKIFLRYLIKLVGKVAMRGELASEIHAVTLRQSIRPLNVPGKSFFFLPGCIRSSLFRLDSALRRQLAFSLLFRASAIEESITLFYLMPLIQPI
jgi:hypothetical protein